MKIIVPTVSFIFLHAFNDLLTRINVFLSYKKIRVRKGYASLLLRQRNFCWLQKASKAVVDIMQCHRDAINLFTIPRSSTRVPNVDVSAITITIHHNIIRITYSKLSYTAPIPDISNSKGIAK